VPAPTAPSPVPPRPGSLLGSIAVALVLATAVLLFAVLPAEYGIDPTGLGRLTGLTRMGEAKVELIETVAANQAEAAVEAKRAELPPDPRTFATNVHRVRLTLRPNEGREIKLLMHADARTRFRWSTGGPRVLCIGHGEPAEGPRQFFEPYGRTTAASGEGVIEARFEGLHGWFWRNDGDAEVTVTLETDGQYENLRVLDNAALEASVPENDLAPATAGLEG